MAKLATYLLIPLCLILGFLGISGHFDAPSTDVVLEGKPLVLLYDLTDAELGDLALPEGAGEQLSEPDPAPVEIPVVEVIEQAVIEQAVVEQAVIDQAVGESGGESAIAAPATECMLVGELRSIGDAQRLQARIQEEGIETFPVTRITEELGPYMVYIPPMANEDEARRVMGLLRSDGLDSLIIRDPPFENGVSLGVFRSDENSADLVSRVRGLDYDVQRRRMSARVELHSFLLSGSRLSSVGEIFWQEIRADFEGIEVVEKSCEEVASASNFQ